MTDTPMTGADVIAAQLSGAGVSQTYGISGQRILPLWHALDMVGIGITLARHEQGAAYMADTHARMTGGIGVAMSTSGPGAINLLGGAAAALMDSVPLLLITAQAATSEFGKYGIQEGTGRGRTPDIQAMFRATTKGSWRPKQPDEIGPMLNKALRIAVTGRPGPVHLDIPSDLFTAAVPTQPTTAGPARATRGPVPERDDIKEVVQALNDAERPLILGGGGLGSPETARLLLEIATEMDIPVAGTFAAKRYLDENNPLVLGPVGIFGRAAANHALHREADLVVAIGVTFSWLSTSGWVASLPPSRLIRVDIDRKELHRNYRAGIELHAESGTFLRALADEASGIAGAGAARAERLRSEYPDDELSGWTSPDGLLHPVQLCGAVNPYLDEQTTVIADVGQNAYWAERYLHTRGDNRFAINAGLGAMGHAVAGAVGAWMARTDMHGKGERVLVTTGDGGFLMSGLEVSTAVDEGAAITWVIFNNGTLGTQRTWFEREGHVPVAVDLPPTSFVELARSLGADGRRVTSPTELEQALAWAIGRRAPSVIDASIDPVPAPAPFTGPSSEEAR